MLSNELFACVYALIISGIARNLANGALLRPEGPNFEAEGRERGGVLATGAPRQLKGLGAL